MTVLRSMARGALLASVALPASLLARLSAQDPVAFLQSALTRHRIVFLGDGKVVDEMLEPTTDRVLDRLKSLEG